MPHIYFAPTPRLPHPLSINPAKLISLSTRLYYRHYYNPSSIAHCSLYATLHRALHHFKVEMPYGRHFGRNIYTNKRSFTSCYMFYFYILPSLHLMKHHFALDKFFTTYLTSHFPHPPSERLFPDYTPTSLWKARGTRNVVSGLRGGADPLPSTSLQVFGLDRNPLFLPQPPATPSRENILLLVLFLASIPMLLRYNASNTS